MVLEKSLLNGYNFLYESWYSQLPLSRQRAEYFLSFLVQNSVNLVDSSEIETLRKECEVAKKKCKEAQEKYFSESDRLKAIIDEQEGMFGCQKWAVGFTRLISLAAVFLSRHATLKSIVWRYKNGRGRDYYETVPGGYDSP